MGRILGLLAMAGVLAAVPARAADLAFVSIDAPPWAGLDDAGRPHGAFVDIVEDLERRTGHRISVTLHPLARVERELESGAQDCAIILWNAARARSVEVGATVYQMTFGVIARRGERLQSYDDLLPLSVSVIRNLRIEERFDTDTALRKDFDKDYAAGLMKMERGRIDAIAGALPTIVAQAARDGLGHVLGDRLVLSTIPLALQCSRRSAALAEMAELNEAIAAMRRDGTLAALLSRHGYH